MTRYGDDDTNDTLRQENERLQKQGAEWLEQGLEAGELKAENKRLERRIKEKEIGHRVLLKKMRKARNKRKAFRRRMARKAFKNFKAMEAKIDMLRGERDKWHWCYDVYGEEGYDAVVEHAEKLYHLLKENVDLMEKNPPEIDWLEKQIMTLKAELEEARQHIGLYRDELSDRHLAQHFVDNQDYYVVQLGSKLKQANERIGRVEKLLDDKWVSSDVVSIPEVRTALQKE